MPRAPKAEKARTPVESSKPKKADKAAKTV